MYEERLAFAFERIATALESFNEEFRQAGTRYWPRPGQQKEAVLSRVPTEEDKIRERQGLADDRPIKDWLEELGDPEGEAEIVGERSRQWIIDHPPEKAKVVDASPKAVSVGEQDTSSVEEVEGKTGSVAVVTTDNKDVKSRHKGRTKNSS
jgi:hypothetical protein